MALTDIIQAIKAQADKEITILQEQAVREKNSIKSKTDEEIALYEKDMKKKTEDRKVAMKKKAETMVEMDRKRVLLEEKRKALDSVYKKALEEVKKLPADKIKKFEDSLKKHVEGCKGDIKPVKEGGFIFVSEKSEEDYSFEHLVNEVLRPQTEITVSAELFS